jgi:hypothetical protein
MDVKRILVGMLLLPLALARRHQAEEWAFRAVVSISGIIMGANTLTCLNGPALMASERVSPAFASVFQRTL